MGQLLYVMVYAASLFFSYDEKKDRICGFQIYGNKIFRFVYIIILGFGRELEINYLPSIFTSVHFKANFF